MTSGGRQVEAGAHWMRDSNGIRDGEEPVMDDDTWLDATAQADLRAPAR
jgi:hypothetical protein